MQNDKINEIKKNLNMQIEEAAPVDETVYNRRKVDSIKRSIVVVFLVMCVIPILFCLYIMARLNGLESKLDHVLQELPEIKAERSMKESYDKVAAEGPEATETEAMATTEKNTEEEALEKGSESESGLLMTSSEGDTDSANRKNGHRVYLTFDDGPSIYTNEILDILNKKNVKATFFVVYNEDRDLWDCYRRIVQDGHTLGMHSYTHVYSTIYASLDSFKEDVDSLHDFLYEQTGVDCDIYRFPGGSSNSVSNVSTQDMIGYLYSEGIQYYDWNALSGDAVYGNISPEQLNNNIMEYVRNIDGDSIVLMHDLKNVHATVESLEALIDTLRAEGYELCAIDAGTTPVQHVSYQGKDE